MQIYLAPLQGLTDWIFRESFFEHIEKFDKTFSPFIRIQDGEFIRPSQARDINPEHNIFQKPVPQFLGNDIESFKKFEELCEKYNYTEANINFGCPFPKVANHGLGSGILCHPTEVANLLEKIFATTNLTLSIKCRLGQEETSEFEQIIPIYNNFPLHEIIIHARTGKQQYKGEVHTQDFAKYASQLKHSVCYNGDIETIADIEKITTLAPNIKAVMIGRGIIKNPFLLAEIKQEQISHDDKIRKLKDFHLAMIERCKEKYSGNLSVLKRFEEMWSLHAEAFEDGRKIFKQVKKCNTVAKYESILNQNLNAIL